jgi:hypothetical protein
VSRRKDDIGDKLEALAVKLVDEALADTEVKEIGTDGKPTGRSCFTDRLEAFKVVAAYHVGVMKVKAKIPDDDDDAPTFDNIRNRLKAVEQKAS